MERSGAILVALALLFVPAGVRAQCDSGDGVIECGGILFAAEQSELRNANVHATGLLAVLPDGRILRADTLSTECRSTCSLTNVTVSGDSLTKPAVHVDSEGIWAEDTLIARLGDPPAAGMATIEFRLADGTPTIGVGALIPASPQRALGTLVAAGPDAVAVSTLLFAGAAPSTRLDVARIGGSTGFVVSGTERLAAGPLTLSLDGTLGNRRGRGFFAGSQRHFGLGREELIVGLTAGDSNGLFSARYIASRGPSGTSDEVLLDGVVNAGFGGLDATLEIGAGAAAADAEFAPSLGTALTLEAPASGRRWMVVPHTSVRVVGEQAQGLMDDSAGADSAGLAGGMFVEVTPLHTDDMELRFLADGAYGAILSAGQADLRAWNEPLDGWRVASGVELRAGRAMIIRWLAEREETDARAAHGVGVDVASSYGWIASQVRFDARGYQGAWAVAGVASHTIDARLIVLQGESARNGGPVLGDQPLRRSRGTFESETALAMGVRLNAGSTTFDAEATYSGASIRGARFGGVGRAALQLPGKEWGLDALVGSLVGRGELYASVGLQLGRHPRVSGWHRR